MRAVVYIHGKGGSAEEAAHYKPLFPKDDVIGFAYLSQTPWDAEKEFFSFVESLSGRYQSIVLIANSIGAWYAMHAGIGEKIEKAFFISPIVDMEKLISGMMAREDVTEKELQKRGTIRTRSGEELSFPYLSYIREHPLVWSAPTEILYGAKDVLTSFGTITAFAEKHHARLTVMADGEHWFHTEKQMRFLDEWIKENAGKRIFPV